MLPVMILLTLGALDVVHYHRTYNALDQAIQEALRCMGSTDGCQLETSLPPSLYSVSAITAETQLQVPLYDIVGTVSGYPLSVLRPSRIEATYIDSAEFRDNSSRQLFERRYTTSVQGTFVSPQQMTVVRDGSNYTVQGGSVHDRTRDFLLMPGESTTFTIRTPDVPFSSTCIERPLSSGFPCSQTEAHMMLLIEGVGSGGTTNTPTIIRLSLNGRSLGGREFLSQGSGNVDADFAPRGSQLVQRFIGLPDWEETDTYKSNLLPYSQKVQIRLENLSGDANWRLSKLALVIPRYETKNLQATCDNSLSKEQIQNSRDCHVTNRLASQKLKALTQLKAVNYLQQREAAPTLIGTIKCSDNLDSRELFSVPEHCNDETQTIQCPNRTTFEGISNFGIAPEIAIESPQWRTQAASLCPVPESATAVRWHEASTVWEGQKLADLSPDTIIIEECSKLPTQLQSLIPASLKEFKNIAVSDYTISELDSEYPRFSTVNYSDERIADLSCLSKRTYNIAQVFDSQILKGVPHSGCNFPNDVVAAPTLPEHVERKISVRANGKFSPLPLGTTEFVDKCQEEVGSLTTIAIQEQLLPLAPLPIDQAQKYCAQHNLTCRYSVAGYSSKVNSIHEQIDVSTAQNRAVELFSTLVNFKDVTFKPQTSLDPVNGNVVVTMEGSTSVQSLLGSLLKVEPTTISIRKSIVSEKSLL